MTGNGPRPVGRGSFVMNLGPEFKKSEIFCTQYVIFFAKIWFSTFSCSTELLKSSQVCSLLADPNGFFLVIWGCKGKAY